MASITQQSEGDTSSITVTPYACVEQNGSRVFTQEPLSIDTGKGSELCANGASTEAEENRNEKAIRDEAEHQTYFDNAARKGLNLPSGYENVAVLIIRWDEELDDPLFKDGHDAEIKRLKEVLGSRFHFDVSSEVRLKNTKKPQHTLNKAIADHIEKFDGPNTLLIVYYTGHAAVITGSDGEERLHLAATNYSLQSSGPRRAVAVWHQAERALTESAEADVLSLLDCCYAAKAYKGTGGELRKYELLAACHRDQITPGPGKNSFTSRLLDALENLLEDDKKPLITLTRLAQMLNTRKTNGPKHSTPVALLDCLDNHLSHIELSPVSKRSKEEKEELQARPPEKAVVKLRFSLAKEHLTQEQIESWAKHMAALIHPQNGEIPIRRIDWVRVDKTRTNRWWEAALRHASNEYKKRKSEPEGSAVDLESPDAKRRMQGDLLNIEEPTESAPPTPMSFSQV